ncbi:maleylacetoacetate isomerase [Phreatobacter aquaticus]|uniref:Maleylacetoacetate isomerase n=1 Tax=Phreatobacter aquaticus TaxID=2570229 RepID=A0A4D7QGL0_9HYPH|nr:maleylacetoacetate isomerase [Phreatobacter aquaticus]QCK85831.1 maleylacetoacetate isomerase [Phreatobacter aquaticus]
MKLYTYFRSTAAFRVRIALHLKGIPYEPVPIHLVRDGGEQKKPSYRAINPQGRVPSLEIAAPGGPTVLTQSLAIIDYLDETVPEPPLLPKDPILRARIRAVAQIVACDIHPVNNSGTIAYLKSAVGAPQDVVDRWYAHFLRDGLAAVEQLIEPGPYAFGAAVTLADLCVVPQVFNAWRFKVPVDDFPKIMAVTEACLKLKAFADARPEAQPDAE